MLVNTVPATTNHLLPLKKPYAIKKRNKPNSVTVIIETFCINCIKVGFSTGVHKPHSNWKVAHAFVGSGSVKAPIE